MSNKNKDNTPPIPFPSGPPRTRRGGYPPKPTAIRIAEGNRGRRPLPILEPQPKPVSQVSDLPEAPPHLDDLAARLWSEEYGPIVVKLKVMTVADWSALAILCTLESRRRILEDDIKEKGRYQWVTTTAGDSVEKPRPQVADLDKVTPQVVSMLREFGLTPSSRPKVQMVLGMGGGSGKGEGGEGEEGGGYFG
jgi:P27 family predicted phage terminase small subunit